MLQLLVTVSLYFLPTCTSFVNLRHRHARILQQHPAVAEKKRTPVVAQDDSTVNGIGTHQTTPHHNTKDKTPTTTNIQTTDDLIDLMIEINSRISNGTESVLRNLTDDMAGGDDMVGYIVEMAEQIRVAQEKELTRQLSQLDRKLREPLENLAFSDVPVYDLGGGKKAATSTTTLESSMPSRDELILMGANSTLGVSSRRMRTKEILQNFNVAPFYYSVALMVRWFRKASYPSIYLLSTFKWLSNVIKSNGGSSKQRQKRRSVNLDGDNLQAGWKRTGEIAAKGPLARRWAILRRSAEIWAYFSSFYLKDRRITAKFTSGQWSEEKYKEERSKLGKEVTQNLLKLGPTFIKGSSFVRIV